MSRTTVQERHFLLLDDHADPVPNLGAPYVGSAAVGASLVNYEWDCPEDHTILIVTVSTRLASGSALVHQFYTMWVAELVEADITIVPSDVMRRLLRFALELPGVPAFNADAEGSRHWMQPACAEVA